MSSVTVVMPQTIPSMVSRLRVVLRLSATQASRMISINIDSDCAGLPGNQAVQKQNAKALTTEDTKVHKGDAAEFMGAGFLCFMPFLSSGFEPKRFDRIDRRGFARGIQG